MKTFLIALFGISLSFAFSASAEAAYVMQLDRVTPASAAPGDTVRLSGRNFGRAPEGYRVIVRNDGDANMLVLRVSQWRDTEIVAVLPPATHLGASTIAILRPLGAAGSTNASQHVPINLIARQPTLKPGVAQQITKPAAGIGKPQVAIKPLGCAIDPGVGMFQAIHPRKAADGSYVFWLVADINNFGTAAFSAAPGQAQYTLYSGSRVLKTGNITTLAAGGRLTSAGMQIEGWRLSDEFPQDFSLQIVYDPDIGQDGKPENDDCRMSNNRKVLSGEAVMRVLRTRP